MEAVSQDVHYIYYTEGDSMFRKPLHSEKPAFVCSGPRVEIIMSEKPEITVPGRHILETQLCVPVGPVDSSLHIVIWSVDSSAFPGSLAECHKARTYEKMQVSDKAQILSVLQGTVNAVLIYCRLAKYAAHVQSLPGPHQIQVRSPLAYPVGMSERDQPHSPVGRLMAV